MRPGGRKRLAVMPSIKIPPREVPKLLSILNLDDGVFTALLKAIDETAPALTPTAYAVALSQKVPGVNPMEIAPILTTTLALYNLKEEKALSASELASDVADAASVPRDGQPDFPRDRKELLKK